MGIVSQLGDLERPLGCQVVESRSKHLTSLNFFASFVSLFLQDCNRGGEPWILS